MANYRKLYENHHNVKIQKGYEIHHLDHNHENNEITNLVCIPRKLHKKYHLYWNFWQNTLLYIDLPWVYEDYLKYSKICLELLSEIETYKK